MNDGGGKCKHCGCDLSKRTRIDNKIQNVCRTCGNVHYIRCDKCRELFSKRHIHFYGRNLCDLCMETELVQCERCGAYVEPGEVRRRKEQMICQSCFDMLHARMTPLRIKEKSRKVDIILNENEEDKVYDNLKRKVDIGAAALWLASESPEENDAASPRQVQREKRQKHGFDWGRIDEEEYDADCDLY